MLQRLLSLALVLLGVGIYLRQVLPEPQLVLPLVELRAPDGHRALSRVPWKAGELSGRNLLLVTLDTTRPDRIAAYGNERIATPNLDRLAHSGAVFTGAVATAPTTLPTHASMLTGRYPHRHAARANGLHSLPAGEETLAERLSAYGYETAAFVSSFALDARFGLQQGFDRYDDAMEEQSQAIVFAERRADRTTRRAVEWLEQRATGDGAAPWFLWVHYYDPHVPYHPPGAFARESENPYDGEIAFVDQMIGVLLGALEAPPARETLIVVVGDHGEGFGEHGEWTHGFLAAEATLRIPLVMATVGAPKGASAPNGTAVTPRFSQVDLMPTLLSVLGLPAARDVDGVDFTHAQDDARPVLAEAVHGREYYGWAALEVLYEGPLKFVDGPRPELYDLHADPLERHDLASSRAQEVQRLRARSRALRGSEASRTRAAPVELSAQDITRLEALGYLVGQTTGRTAGQTARASSDADPQRVPGPDPKDMLPLMNEVLTLMNGPDRHASMTRLQRALVFLLGERLPTNPAALIEALEAFVSRHPGFAPAHRYLASLYTTEGRPEDAARAQAVLEALHGSAEPRAVIPGAE